MKTRIWIITDTHLGHDAIVEYCGRPLNHSELILENVAKLVQPYDLFIHLGDICIGHDFEWNAKMAQAAQGATRILVKGNHDRKSYSWYYDHGWDLVCESFEMMAESKRIAFSHIPIADHGFDLNIHGHFHNKTHRSERPEMKQLLTPKHKLLAVEHTNYQPVLLSTLLKQYAKDESTKNNSLPVPASGDSISRRGNKQGGMEI